MRRPGSATTTRIARSSRSSCPICLPAGRRNGGSPSGRRPRPAARRRTASRWCCTIGWPPTLRGTCASSPPTCQRRWSDGPGPRATASSRSTAACPRPSSSGTSPRAGTEWQVNEPLRRLVDARQLNLAAPFPPLPPVDVLFLRNVLIYFQAETRRQIFERVRRVLRPDGYLVLGGAETALNVDAFERVPLDKATVYRPRGGRAAT